MFAVFLLFLPLLAIVTAKVAEWEVCWVNGALTEVPAAYFTSRSVYHWVYLIFCLVSLVTSFSSNLGFLIFLIVFFGFWRSRGSKCST